MPPFSICLRRALPPLYRFYGIFHLSSLNPVSYNTTANTISSIDILKHFSSSSSNVRAGTGDCRRNHRCSSERQMLRFLQGRINFCTLDHAESECSFLQENEYHKLADSTIYELLEKLEEYGDRNTIDDFDIDYGNQVLTLKLGSLGTYVLNKQTPNKQLWLSSPVSGPLRFDWDNKTKAWIYRRMNAPLLQLLEEELKNLCGQPIKLS